ncbi:hypothetical protein NEOKW01_1721 [Nematocida sp. AWRm80]|nr:hypothetical protein NEOKW01_0318 [Nematocida sp. AWRm80]KAI5181545.1 hypothetical protein NEOKW01_1721 [Nematocida sp. AWRm80]
MKDLAIKRFLKKYWTIVIADVKNKMEPDNTRMIARPGLEIDAALKQSLTEIANLISKVYDSKGKDIIEKFDYLMSLLVLNNSISKNVIQHRLTSILNDKTRNNLPATCTNFKLIEDIYNNKEVNSYYTILDYMEALLYRIKNNNKITTIEEANEDPDVQSLLALLNAYDVISHIETQKTTDNVMFDRTIDYFDALITNHTGQNTGMLYNVVNFIKDRFEVVLRHLKNLKDPKKNKPENIAYYEQRSSYISHQASPEVIYKRAKVTEEMLQSPSKYSYYRNPRKVFNYSNHTSTSNLSNILSRTKTRISKNKLKYIVAPGLLLLSILLITLVIVLVHKGILPNPFKPSHLIPPFMH